MTTTFAPVAASSRATARPAKLAPQIRTSQSRSSGVRSAPRLVALTGIAAAHDRRGALHDRPARGPGAGKETDPYGRFPSPRTPSYTQKPVNYRCGAQAVTNVNYH